MNTKKIENLIRELLIEIGENPNREGLIETPKRVAKMYEEIYSGINKNPENLIKVFTEKNSGNWVIVKDIPVYSMCEHHLMPFIGYINVLYIPSGDKVVGLSKILRVVDIISKRLQLQERLCEQVADALENTLHPKGLGVYMEAEHTCMTMRGIKKVGARTATLTTRGILQTQKQENEDAIHALMNGGKHERV